MCCRTHIVCHLGSRFLQLKAFYFVKQQIYADNFVLSVYRNYFRRCLINVYDLRKAFSWLNIWCFFDAFLQIVWQIWSYTEQKKHSSKIAPSGANSSQAQRLMIRRLWVQAPLGQIFDKIYFVLCNFRSVRQYDRNASDWPIVKNPNANYLKALLKIFLRKAKLCNRSFSGLFSILLDF